VLGGDIPAIEAPLRAAVLKAYQEAPQGDARARRLNAAVRQFLSGPPGTENFVTMYWFEEDPAASVRSFVEDLDRVKPGLAMAMMEPVLTSFAKRGVQGDPLASVHLSVTSLAGSLAVKTGLDETMACAILSAVVLGLLRVAAEPFQDVLRGSRETTPEAPSPP
jgi:hypothetical protein